MQYRKPTQARDEQELLAPLLQPVAIAAEAEHDRFTLAIAIVMSRLVRTNTTLNLDTTKFEAEGWWFEVESGASFRVSRSVHSTLIGLRLPELPADRMVDASASDCTTHTPFLDNRLDGLGGLFVEGNAYHTAIGSQNLGLGFGELSVESISRSTTTKDTRCSGTLEDAYLALSYLHFPTDWIRTAGVVDSGIFGRSPAPCDFKPLEEPLCLSLVGADSIPQLGGGKKDLYLLPALNPVTGASQLPYSSKGRGYIDCTSTCPKTRFPNNLTQCLSQ
ncbi:hypothetical protein BKA70DRAFT_1227260 [Coprinopsis sp. MPI-PUGE-AT-0042]|nr:hypothetical protein BKA70DRAFT_1227260 [Coprinopsis sp. MPI-PUGE-AT-0042]